MQATALLRTAFGSSRLLIAVTAGVRVSAFGLKRGQIGLVKMHYSSPVASVSMAYNYRRNRRAVAACTLLLEEAGYSVRSMRRINDKLRSKLTGVAAALANIEFGERHFLIQCAGGNSSARLARGSHARRECAPPQI